jgi:phosphotransferase system enzyme I (PtsP)
MHREVSVCGELAGDPMGAVLLIGLGYRNLSMSAANLLRVKAVLRQLSIAEMVEIADRVSELADPTSVKLELRRALQRPGLERLLHAQERPRRTA